MGGDGVCRSLYMCMRVRAYCILQTLRTLHIVQRWAVLASTPVYIRVCVYAHFIMLTSESLHSMHTTHCPYTHIVHTRTVCIYILYIHTHSIYTCIQVCMVTVDASGSTFSATDADSSWTLLGSDCVCCNV